MLPIRERNAFCDQIRKARKECWSGFLERATGDDLWTVIRYTRQRRTTELPTLVTPSGDTAESESEKAAALASISFPGPEGYHGDDGLPGEQGEAVSVLEADDSWISRATKGQRARSAPGMDGMGAPVLQLLWRWGHQEVHRLMVECLRAGVHCQNWKSARAVVIPKPGRDNYSLCKSYRVISLLRCLGKVLERVVCGLLELQVCRLGALHRGQFGSIRRRSAVDAVATLVTICEREWSRGRCVGALCMDVQAAFPNVNPACLTRRLRECGVDEGVVRWVRDFMSNRTVLFGASRGPVDGLAVFRAIRGPRPYASADSPGHSRIIHLMQNRLPCIVKTAS